MPSTYTNSLRITDQETGANENTWGDIVDVNWDLIDDAIAGRHDEDATGSGDITLSSNNGAVDEARNMILNFSGTPSANRNVIVPAVTKIYIVTANHGGSNTLTLKTSGGTGVDFSSGEKAIIACDGTDIVKIADVTAGTDSTKLNQTGEVKIWGGTIADIPSGFLICDGSAVSRITYAALFSAIGTVHGNGDNATTFNLPDLRDKFVIGANQDDSGVPKTNVTGSLTTTGGSKDVTIAQANLPNITLSVTGTTNTTGAHSHSYDDYNQSSVQTGGAGSQADDVFGSKTTSSAGNHSHTVTGDTEALGSGTSLEVLPPYYTMVYMIKT